MTVRLASATFIDLHAASYGSEGWGSGPSELGQQIHEALHTLQEAVRIAAEEFAIRDMLQTQVVPERSRAGSCDPRSGICAPLACPMTTMARFQPPTSS
jgi:hypothetical protein